MTENFVRPRIVAAGFVLALFTASALAPIAGAGPGLHVKSVGDIFVDAAGHASGQNVQTSIVEATGVLEGFTALALDTEIFGSVEIDGFAQAEKLQGVGSSTILLRGSNAVVSVYDNINSAFKVQATSPTTVRYDLSNGIHAESRGAHAVDVYDGAGAYLGSLVVVGANGAAGSADGIRIADGAAQARLNAGSQVVWHAKPVYADSASYNDAVVDAMADGRLASLVVTDFQGSSERQSAIDYFAHVKSETRAATGEAVESRVTSRSASSAMIAYDLAYETLPARSAEDLTLYVDGQAAARASSPAEVRENSEAGIASYYALAAEGRTLVLASTPDFRSQAEHHLSLVAQAPQAAQSESQAKAEARSESEARAVGDFLLHGSGRLTGAFTTSTLAPGDARVIEYTSLASRTTVFQSIDLDGGAAATAEQVSAHEVRMSAPNVDLSFVDDAYGSLVMHAHGSSAASFDLGAGVKAVAESGNLVRLEGPNGYTGLLVLVPGEGENEYRCMSTECTGEPIEEPEPIQPGASRLAVTGEGHVRAQMQDGSRVVYRETGTGRAYASEDVIAHAIAEGRVGAQLLAGINANGLSTSAVQYATGVSATATSRAHGSFDVNYAAQTAKASSFVFDTRGTALAAKSAADVQVLVNGQAATAVSAPQDVFASANGPRFFVESALDGSSRILVNTAAIANQASQVTIQSKVQTAARAAANSDAFGTFRTFQGGTAIGSFVTLKADQQAGSVHDFALLSTGEKVFTSISAGASAFTSVGADGAPQLNLENRESHLTFTDTTSAYMNLVAKQQTNAQFALAQGITAEKKAAGVIELSNAAGQHVGSLVITNVNGEASAASGFSTDAANQVRAHLDKGSQVIFRTHVGVEQELSAQERGMMNQAVAAGRVAGQVVVQTSASLSAQAHAAADAAAAGRGLLESTSATAVDGGATSVAAIQAHGSATTSVTTSYYPDVQMLTAATKDRIDVTVSSATKVGKTVIISLDPATLPSLGTGDAEILVDSRAAAQADSYADILNPLDDEGAFEYFVLTSEAGSQVLVSMPHFSTHVVTLKAKETGATPVFMYATLFLSVLVVAETVILVRRRYA